jgi:membrane-bound metal-dependent hydrolase YbcI (DUF457 family)
MPFTPLHLGPALAFGLPLRRIIHLPTFIVANVILDVEPLLIILLGTPFPLHGYLHTFLSAVAVGLLLGYVMFKIEKPLKGFYLNVQLETSKTLPLKAFLTAGVSGAALHVLLDALLYSEMHPFYPLLANPFLEFHLSSLSVTLMCFWLGVFSLFIYVSMFVYSMFKKR